jgi:hypothetical protein
MKYCIKLFETIPLRCSAERGREGEVSLARGCLEAHACPVMHHPEFRSGQPIAYIIHSLNSICQHNVSARNLRSVTVNTGFVIWNKITLSTDLGSSFI